MNTPIYSIRVSNRLTVTGIGFAFGTQVFEIDNPKNIGFSDYLNDVPEAFFTLYQEDPQVQALRDLEGRGHVRIYRYDPVTGENAIVWNGWFGTDTEINGTDVIFYCHGYLSTLYWLLTDWNTVWDNATLGTIASALWTRAKTTITDSEANFVTTGTIQDPVTTSGGATALTLPVYTVFNKRILFVMRELAAIGRSDTTNNVVFEITHGTNPTFNFWKNKGSDTTAMYEYGDHQIKDFKIIRTPANLRNSVKAVGTSPRDLILRKDIDAAVGSYGRRQEPLYLQWVRDQTELDRVAALRLARANRLELDLEVIAYPGGVLPPGMSYSPWKLADRITIRINRGNININDLFLVSGYQVYYINGMEHTKMFLEQRSGT